MLLLIRFFYLALLLIFTQLIMPAFQPGGRFLILLIALGAALLTQIIRKITSGKLGIYQQAPLGGTGIFITLFLSGHYFAGVKLTFLGILATYLGSVLLELLLPDEWHELIYRKYQRRD